MHKKIPSHIRLFDVQTRQLHVSYDGAYADRRAVDVRKKMKISSQ